MTWDIANQRKVLRFPAHPRGIAQVAWAGAQDPKLLVTVGDEGTLRAWDAPSTISGAATSARGRGKEVDVPAATFEITMPREKIRRAAFHPFKPHTLVTASDQGALALWDIRALSSQVSGAVGLDGTPRGLLLRQENQLVSSVTACEWHPTITGLLATTTSNNCLQVWHVGDGAPLRTRAPSGTALAMLEANHAAESSSALSAVCLSKLFTPLTVSGLAWRREVPHHIATYSSRLDTSVQVWDVTQVHTPVASYHNLGSTVVGAHWLERNHGAQSQTGSAAVSSWSSVGAGDSSSRSTPSLRTPAVTGGLQAGALLVACAKSVSVQAPTAAHAAFQVLPNTALAMSSSHVAFCQEALARDTAWPGEEPDSARLAPVRSLLRFPLPEGGNGIPPRSIAAGELAGLLARARSSPDDALNAARYSLERSARMSGAGHVLFLQPRTPLTGRLLPPIPAMLEPADLAARPGAPSGGAVGAGSSSSGGGDAASGGSSAHGQATHGTPGQAWWCGVARDLLSNKPRHDFSGSSPQFPGDARMSPRRYATEAPAPAASLPVGDVAFLPLARGYHMEPPTTYEAAKLTPEIKAARAAGYASACSPEAAAEVVQCCVHNAGVAASFGVHEARHTWLVISLLFAPEPLKVARRVAKDDNATRMATAMAAAAPVYNARAQHRGVPAWVRAAEHRVSWDAQVSSQLHALLATVVELEDAASGELGSGALQEAAGLAGPAAAALPAAESDAAACQAARASWWLRFRDSVLRQVFDWYIFVGDVQFTATLARVLLVSAAADLSKLGADDLACEEWERAYIDLLHAERAWTPASVVMARSKQHSVQALNTEDTTLRHALAAAGAAPGKVERLPLPSRNDMDMDGVARTERPITALRSLQDEKALREAAISGRPPFPGSATSLPICCDSIAFGNPSAAACVCMVCGLAVHGLAWHCTVCGVSTHTACHEKWVDASGPGCPGTQFFHAIPVV